jgi:hypothetical protein
VAGTKSEASRPSAWHTAPEVAESCQNMLRPIALSRQARGPFLPVLTASLAATAGVASCVASAPADPPASPPEGPLIVQDLVIPAPTQLVTHLPPQGFLVPVRVTNAVSAIACRVFVDFDPGSDNNQFATPPAYSCPNNTFPAVDGGLTDLRFTISSMAILDPTKCHVIQFFVADSFDPNSTHTPGDSLGADSVTWQYVPNSAGCLQFDDAGDGAPPPDSQTDGLLQVPDQVSPSL